MNCWEVLGISPTRDQHEIKKAYAHAVTLHHPEDDPNGFQTVYRAFRQAIAYSKGKGGIPAEFFGDESFLQISEPTIKKPAASESKKESPEQQGLMYYAVEADANPQQKGPSKLENLSSETPEPARNHDSEQPLPNNQENEGIEAKSEKDSQGKPNLLYYAVEADANPQQKGPSKLENLSSETPEPPRNQDSEQPLPNSQASTRTADKLTASEQKTVVSKQTRLRLEHLKADDYNFDDVIKRGKAAEEEQIESFLKTLDSIFQEKKVSKRLKKWKQCFSSNEFVLFSKSDEFISSFLSYLIDQGDIKRQEWVVIFTPMLQNMLYYYPTGKEHQKILLLMRRWNKWGSTNTHKISFAFAFLWFIIGISCLIWLIPKNLNHASNYTSSPVYVSTPVYLEIKLPEIEIKDVYNGIMAGESYSSLSRECEDLGITQEDYNRMKSEYASSDENARNRIARELTDYYMKMINQSSSGTSTAIA
jgi:hypothetical protein